MKNPNTLSKSAICAVVVTRDPSPDLKSRLATVKDQVSEIVLVDNGSFGRSLTSVNDAVKINRVSLLTNEGNLGIATALNQGIQVAIERGYSWVLSLDQDSLPANDMVEQMCNLYSDLPNQTKIAILAPKIIDANVGKEARYLRKKSLFRYQHALCTNTLLDDVTMVITSGALINLSVYKEIGGYREDFFIDYVDTEYCLRAILKEFRIIVACQAELQHGFGNRQEVGRGPLTLYPSFHPPNRWYTSSRNRIPMIIKFGRKLPHWLLYEFVASAYIIMRMILTEDRKLAKIQALFQGSWDGVRGKMGPPPWGSSPTSPTIRERTADQ
jgi:rhamnosyltransferase